MDACPSGIEAYYLITVNLLIETCSQKFQLIFIAKCLNPRFEKLTLFAD